MPIRADKNLYPGINPHLNSFLQQPGGGWKSFHTTYLNSLFEALDTLLPEGYYVTPEESLQVGVYDAEIEFPVRPAGGSIADLLIHHGGETSQIDSSASPSSTPTLTLSIPRLIDDEDVLAGLVIYSDQGEGKPITRIELLSPANKPQGSHYGTYLTKRAETLYAGLCLVELDYLHERRPILENIPSYPDRHPNAYPYYIAVTDPRPSIEKGRTHIYGFGVLQDMPIVDIPLDGDDKIPIDFGSLYNQTFSKRTFRRNVDYEKEPINFSTYTEADQVQIKQWMLKIQQSAL